MKETPVVHTGAAGACRVEWRWLCWHTCTHISPNAFSPQPHSSSHSVHTPRRIKKKKKVSHVFTVLIPGLIILIMLKDKSHADSFRGRGKSVSKGLVQMHSRHRAQPGQRDSLFQLQGSVRPGWGAARSSDYVLFPLDCQRKLMCAGSAISFNLELRRNILSPPDLCAEDKSQQTAPRTEERLRSHKA